VLEETIAEALCEQVEHLVCIKIYTQLNLMNHCLPQATKKQTNKQKNWWVFATVSAICT